MKKLLFPYLLIIALVLSSCSQKEEVCTPPQMKPANVETMSFIPGGKFLMGHKSGGVFKDRPLKAAYVSSFYLDKTEVTNEMYLKYIGEKKCSKEPKYINDKELGGAKLPVVDVSYTDAKEFCKFYGKRLPTEAEWEYAARGGLEMNSYPWGNKASDTMMNYRGSEKNWAVAVKSYPPNKYGLYDMSGNVREWVVDTYERGYYKCPQKKKFKAAGVDLSGFFKEIDTCRINPVNTSKGQFKVNRGGSWHYTNGYPPTVDFRSFDKPSYKGNDLGFRCASGTQRDNILVKKLKEMNKKISEELGVEIPEDIPKDISKEEMKNAFGNKFKELKGKVGAQVGVDIPDDISKESLTKTLDGEVNKLIK
jgi:formylglycine-generating enzyme required for sulfatase activity